jgi:hypothetical protein
MVTGQLLLLCLLHCCDIHEQYHGNPSRDKKGMLEALVFYLLVKATPLWQTIKRMREMSRYTCKTDALIDGACQ